MSFDVFENIYTASDPAGGRAIKVSASAGIDNIDSYYTVSDPAGGRALKVKIISGGGGGGGSTGTLQTLGGVALSVNLISITDSASPSANISPLSLSTGSVEISRTGSSGNYLFVVNGDTSHGFARINAADGYISMLEFTSASLRVGDIRANSSIGLGLVSDMAFPIRFYTNGDVNNQVANFDTIGGLNTFYSISVLDINELGYSKISFESRTPSIQYGLIYSDSRALDISSKDSAILTFSTGTTVEAVRVDLDGTVNTIGTINVGKSVNVTGTNGDGHIHLKHQAIDATATGQSTALFADSGGDIKWKNDGAYYTTLQTSLNTDDTVYVFPLNGSFTPATYTLASLESQQTFTSLQTFSTGINSRYVELPNQALSPAGTIGNATVWADSAGRFSFRYGTGFSSTFDLSNLSTNRAYKLPNADTDLAGLSLSQTFSAAQIVSVAGTVTSIVSGLSVQAATLATSAVPNQYSPSLFIGGRAWNTSLTSSILVGFRAYVKTYSGNPIAQEFILQNTVDGSNYNESLRISQASAFTFRNYVAMVFPSSGIINIGNQNQSLLTRLVFGQANTAGPALSISSTTISATLGDGTGSTFLKGKLQTDTAAGTYTSTAFTKTLTIYDNTGTAYTVPCY